MQRVLKENYGIIASSFSPVGLGSVNETTRVGTPDGAYVLKRYDPRLYQPDQISRTCEVQVRLSIDSLPIPGMIPNLAGTYVTEAAGAFYVLQEFAPGRHYTRGQIPPGPAYAMGRSLGRLHQALTAMQPVEPYTLPDPEPLAATLHRILRQAELGRSEVDAVACQVLRYKLGALERLSRLLPKLQSLPPQWVHGDYQETNLLFDADDEVAAILDFDNLRCRPRAAEVMRAFDYCFPPDADGRIAFFRGYVRTVRPPDEEVALFAPFRAYYAVASTWPIQTRYLEPEVYQTRWDRFIRPPSDWWERNLERVTAELLAANRVWRDHP